MKLQPPVDFQPSLTTERLSKVAEWLLEEWYATEDDLVRDTDTPYTRGTTRFGRQKQRIVNEYLKGTHDWLSIENSTFDLVFSIGGIPCRFSNDNASAPTKRAVLEVHRFQMPLIEFAEPGQAVRFCFVIDCAMDEFSGPCVELLGFTATDGLVCRWKSKALVRTLIDVKQAVPDPVEISKPIVAPKRRSLGADVQAAPGGK
ncbi:hypothetical protein [Polaromonas sp. CG_23.6]|uniref:hypothetical protein n=1 Tax=Polaromonas sp. CG_23.6 TaxID=2760709 RepID=UPI0024742D34|nr:hypothetical protein [Polaromonas sp. CG_23.6]MDH6186904.1 hypothetical protein [Polaromonas sp. CG_23.6]